MTTWYQPKQRLSDGRWDMTRSNSSGSNCHPIGYCHARREPEASDWCSQESADRENARTLPFAAKFHSSGHATSEEASACWLDYQLDLALTFRDSGDTQRKCAECGEWTPRVAQLGSSIPRQFNLCPTHCTREIVAKHATESP